MLSSRTLAIASTIVCALALAGLLISERSSSTRGRYATKPLASLAFIVLAMARGALTAEGYGLWIVLGLVLGAVGDVALMFPSDRAFLGGLVAFLLGHLAYVLAFATVTPIAGWVTPGALAVVLGASLVLRWLWPHLDEMRVPVIVYVIVITTMAVGAVAAPTSARRLLDDGQATLLTLGALLFFASDIAVARDKFVAKGFANRAWGLPAYYGGQCLLAWSVASIG